MKPVPVLLHGFGTSRRLWRAVLPLLEPGALAFDLPGFNDAAEDGRVTVDGMADAVLEGIRAAQLQRFVLIGHSMGGKVAAVVASRRPLGLGGLMLIAPSPPSPEPMTARQRADLKALCGDAEGLREHYRQITRRPLTEATLSELIQDGLRASRVAWNAWPDSGSRENRSDDALRIDVPVSILTSPDDPVITPDVVAGQLQPLFPHARFQGSKGSGHLLPLEVPAKVATALSNFLEELAAD
ncbi:alpha/beta fold hydrolase [Deinococcus ruber]|uniref:Hydrolase n=1 Tax=Deinococcus ruber TaxID=1848197 RepID=A0A918CEP6_9DEIO|nr:alpha/beta hydrolase [Deinococcus ruber]GGR20004.1 hydrolase [Deinococcus ruber]